MHQNSLVHQDRKSFGARKVGCTTVVLPMTNTSSTGTGNPMTWNEDFVYSPKSLPYITEEVRSIMFSLFVAIVEVLCRRASEFESRAAFMQ